MVKTVELKPPQEIVDAIQASDDSSTAPPDAEVIGGTAGSRVIGNKLAHEEPQKPSDLPDELRHGDDHGANPTGPMSADDKKVMFESSQAQQKAMQYDRQHPGAGHAGKGDQAINSAHGISRDARKQQGAHDQRHGGPKV